MRHFWRAVASLEKYLSGSGWFRHSHPEASQVVIAYLSAEWSETFLQTVERSMRDRPSDAEVPDWYEHCSRLARWRHDAEQARKEYLEGCPTQLRELYNFWRNLGRFRSWG
jgi:hypothetical protein